MSNTLPAPREPAKEPRISKKIRAAIDALVSGEAANITTAAAAAGLSREHFSRELSKPHVTDLLQQKTKRNLAVSVARAGQTKVALLDSGNEMVRDRASSFILGVAGIGPQSNSGTGADGNTPGVVIQIISPDQARPVINAAPITLDPPQAI